MSTDLNHMNKIVRLIGPGFNDDAWSSVEKIFSHAGYTPKISPDA